MVKQKKFEPSFENLPIDQIIGAPLRATASANAMMAKEQLQFLMDFCFKKEGDNFTPVMIEMVMVRSQMTSEGSPDGTPQLRRFSTKFNLPLLTVIPINSLSVESFEIDFDVEITALESKGMAKSLENILGVGNSGKSEFKLMGKVSNNSNEQLSRNSQYQKKIDSKLSINIKGGQLPLPVGITSLLDLYKNNMDPVTVPEDITKDKEE